MVKAATIVLVGCLLLSGCATQTPIADNATEPDLQSSMPPQENTMPDDIFVDEVPEDSVPGTASSEPPHENTVATEANSESNDVPNTPPTTSPTESTVATTPENQDATTPDNGIELPDHNWD